MTVLYYIEKKILIMKFLREMQEISKRLQTVENSFILAGLLLKGSLLTIALRQSLENLVSMNYKVLFKNGSIKNNSSIRFAQGEFVMPFADEIKKVFPEANHNNFNIYIQDRINTDKDFVNKLRDKIRGVQK